MRGGRGRLLAQVRRMRRVQTLVPSGVPAAVDRRVGHRPVLASATSPGGLTMRRKRTVVSVAILGFVLTGHAIAQQPEAEALREVLALVGLPHRLEAIPKPV